MEKVSKETFFAEIMGKNLNVHPRPEKHASFWEFPDRTLFGKSTPGYLCEGPTEYFLAR